MKRGYVPTDPKELCNKIFYTCFMGTKNNSDDTKDRHKKKKKKKFTFFFFLFCFVVFSLCEFVTLQKQPQTPFRAAQIAKDIGSYHLDISIDDIVKR